MKPIVAIGDVHGLSEWKPIVRKHEGCRIVFLGDYLDPYEYVPRRQLLQNLCEIMSLKEKHPDKVVLLLGNHDLHYFCDNAVLGSRFDFQIEKEASQLFLRNIGLFQYAYQEDNWIFTHAGISRQWFDNDFQGNFDEPIDRQLNHPCADQLPALFRVGLARGGKCGSMGGIFWADIEELKEPLPGFIQVVGHNRVDDVTEHVGTGGGKIIFCDCLRWGKYGEFSWLDED